MADALTIALVQMPFAALSQPSLGLLQVEDVVARQCRDEVQKVTVLHLHLDFTDT